MTVAAIVLDVDGTLLTSEHRVTAASRTAIANARCAGVRVLLASSRGPAGLRAVVEDVDVDDPLITFGGALVCDRRDASADSMSNVHFEQRLGLDSARSVATSAARMGIEVAWHAGGRCYSEAIGDGLRREAAITGQTIEPLRGEMPAPHKLMCIVHPAQRGSELEALRTRLPADCDGQYSHRNYLEVVAKDVDKSVAVGRACARLGIAPGAVAAIGDGANDIGLLRFAGTGIAMGHAPPPVRREADWVTATNDEDGVALAIRRLLATGARHSHGSRGT